MQLHLKSTNGPIEVYLCPEEILEDSPAKESSFPTPSLQDSSDGTDPSPGKGNAQLGLQGSPPPSLTLSCLTFSFVAATELSPGGCHTCLWLCAKIQPSKPPGLLIAKWPLVRPGFPYGVLEPRPALSQLHRLGVRGISKAGRGLRAGIAGGLRVGMEGHRQSYGWESQG